MTNSGYDLAGLSLGHAMQETMLPMNSNYNSNGQLYMFDQTPFCSLDNDCQTVDRMLDYGYVYIPTKCLTEKCKSTIWWHGCGGTAGYPGIGTKVMRGTGILEHASANEFVAIFPQAWDPSDGYGYWEHCWASSETQQWDHPQLSSIRRMLSGMFGKEILDDDHPIPAYTENMAASYVSV